jgi:hypothetical protein
MFYHIFRRIVGVRRQDAEGRKARAIPSKLARNGTMRSCHFWLPKVAKSATWLPAKRPMKEDGKPARGAVARGGYGTVVR